MTTSHELQRLERERCAKVCDGTYLTFDDGRSARATADQIAESIRELPPQGEDGVVVPLAALTDPENQPSQWGTMPLEAYEKLAAHALQITDALGLTVAALKALDAVLEFNEPWTDGSDAVGLDRERLNQAFASARNAMLSAAQAGNDQAPKAQQEAAKKGFVTRDDGSNAPFGE